MIYSTCFQHDLLMAKRFIISQFKCPKVTITYFCKEVINGPFVYNRYYVMVLHHHPVHTETLYSGMYSKEAPARYGLEVMKYLDTLQSCK